MSGHQEIWCQPADQPKRQFLVIFDDPQMELAVFDNEDEARAFWEKANQNWKCYLMATLPRLRSERSLVGWNEGFETAIEQAASLADEKSDEASSEAKALREIKGYARAKQLDKESYACGALAEAIRALSCPPAPAKNVMASTPPVVDSIPRGLEQPEALHQREGETTATLAHPQSWCLPEGRSGDTKHEQLTLEGFSVPCASSGTKLKDQTGEQTQTVVCIESSIYAQSAGVMNKPGPNRETLDLNPAPTRHYGRHFGPKQLMIRRIPSGIQCATLVGTWIDRNGARDKRSANDQNAGQNAHPTNGSHASSPICSMTTVHACDETATPAPVEIVVGNEDRCATYEDILRVVCGHLELPQSESGPADDIRMYDRALEAMDEYTAKADADLAENTRLRFKAEAKVFQLRKVVEELKFALFSSDMTIKDRADQSARLALSAVEGSEG